MYKKYKSVWFNFWKWFNNQFDIHLELEFRIPINTLIARNCSRSLVSRTSRHRNLYATRSHACPSHTNDLLQGRKEIEKKPPFSIETIHKALFDNLFPLIRKGIRARTQGSWFWWQTVKQFPIKLLPMRLYLRHGPIGLSCASPEHAEPIFNPFNRAILARHTMMMSLCGGPFAASRLAVMTIIPPAWFKFIRPGQRPGRDQARPRARSCQ